MSRSVRIVRCHGADCPRCPPGVHRDGGGGGGGGGDGAGAGGAGGAGGGQSESLLCSGD